VLETRTVVVDTKEETEVEVELEDEVADVEEVEEVEEDEEDEEDVEVDDVVDVELAMKSAVAFPLTWIVRE
jgi:hypothetical protein